MKISEQRLFKMISVIFGKKKKRVQIIKKRGYRSGMFSFRVKSVSGIEFSKGKN